MKKGDKPNGAGMFLLESWGGDTPETYVSFPRKKCPLDKYCAEEKKSPFLSQKLRELFIGGPIRDSFFLSLAPPCVSIVNVVVGEGGKRN